MAERSDPSRELRIVHVFDAPRERVFDAFTDPDQIGLWWAPPGFVIPRDSIDVQLRVGGSFAFTLQASDGSAAFPYPGEIAELVVPELLVIRVQPIPGIDLSATSTRVLLEAEDHRTRMTLTSGPYTDGVRPDAEAGWNAALTSLARLLASVGS